MTEQSNTKTWRQYFVHNLRLLRTGRFKHGQVSCKEEVESRRDPSSPETLLYLRAIQGHSGGKHIDLRLQDNVLLPNDFAEHIFHVGSSGGKMSRKGGMRCSSQP